MIAEEQDDGICPCDSASNVPSRASQKSSRSSLAKAAAKKAALLAKQQHLGKLRALEEQKLQLEQQKLQQQLQASASERRLELDSKELNLQIDIDAQSAEERVYQQQLEYEQLTGFPTPNPHLVRDPLSLPAAHVSPSLPKFPSDQFVTERRKTTGKDNIGPDLFENDYVQSSSVNPVASSAPSASRGVTFKKTIYQCDRRSGHRSSATIYAIAATLNTSRNDRVSAVDCTSATGYAASISTDCIYAASIVTNCTCAIAATYATPAVCSSTNHPGTVATS